MNFADLQSLSKPQIPPLGWDEVETTLRSLNGAGRCIFAFAPRGSSNAERSMLVAGHRQSCTITVHFPGGSRARFVNPHVHDGDLIEIYNDGLLVDEVDERYVCGDLSCLLKAARHFWNEAELLPDATWEWNDQPSM